MADYEITFRGVRLTLIPSGALWLQDARALAVSDLHLGKAERIARVEGRLTPPYETRETLARLSALVAEMRPRTVILLGDSFDDDAAAESLAAEAAEEIARMMAGRRWIWIAGNHDPAPTSLGGTHLAEYRDGPLTFRHMAAPGAEGEISGHYHPKASLRGRRPCFLADSRRIIMPAFGLYTGGLDVTDPVFDPLMGPEALALMTGRRITPAPRAALAGRRSAGGLQRVPARRAEGL